MTNAIKNTLSAMTLAAAVFTTPAAYPETLKVQEPAPDFKTVTHDGKSFSLEDRKGKWTVLFFFPKAETPGCTKQVCAFRDNIKKIRDLGAEVYGLSADNTQDLAAFHSHHNLNFTLLADPELKIIEKYGTKMTVFSRSKRWTFIIDDKLMIRSIDRDVDPVLDARKVADAIASLKKG
ncbi:MAG: peroxiredoxin [Spirochaetia bacterium]|nr:peroxiredoxin [Spirochaetia bacterium]